MEEEPPFTAETLIKLAQDTKVIGLGETGLDYYYERSDRTKQKQGFLAHIEASQKTGLPVIVHTRSADDDTIEILQEQYAKQKFPALIHCFSTGAKLAYAAIELGMYISISGIVTFKKANELQETDPMAQQVRLLSDYLTQMNTAAPAAFGDSMSTLSSAKINDMESVAHKRKQLLQDLAAENPQKFLQYATLSKERKTFPEEIQPYLEQLIGVYGSSSELLNNFSQ